MYKKYCLIANILLLIPVITITMEIEVKVEPKKQQKIEWIHIQTSNKKTFHFHPDSSLFTKSAFFRTIIKCQYKEKGTATNPIHLQNIDSKQLKLIHKVTVGKKDPEELKWYLRALDIENLNKLIAIGNFLNVKELFKSVAPYLARQLRDPNVLNTWIQSGKNKTLTENQKLSEHVKHYLTCSIKPTPQYLQQKELIPSGTLTDAFKWRRKDSVNSVTSRSKLIIKQNIKKDTKIHTLTGHKKRITLITCSSDGKTLALGSNDGTITLWNIETNTKIHTLKGHGYFVNSAVFNQDSTILVSNSLDKTIKLWDVKTGTEILTFTGHECPVNEVALSPNETTLASESYDNTITVWNLVDKQEIKQLSTFELLLINAWQHTGAINLTTYKELKTIYDKSSDLAKTLMSQSEK